MISIVFQKKNVQTKKVSKNYLYFVWLKQKKESFSEKISASFFFLCLIRLFTKFFFYYYYFNS